MFRYLNIFKKKLLLPKIPQKWYFLHFKNGGYCIKLQTMLEIFVLLALLKPIEALAKRKGLKPYKWRLITVGAWFGCEFAFGFVTYMVTTNILIAYGAAIVGAIGSYFYVKNKLNQLPDKEDDLLTTLGQDLQ